MKIFAIQGDQGDQGDQGNSKLYLKAKTLRDLASLADAGRVLNCYTVLLVLLCLLTSDLWAVQTGTAKLSDDILVTKNIEYREIDGHKLQLDLYQPKHADKESPLVIWVHGGAWRKGSKTNCPITWLCDKGFAIASVNYRLTGVALWPAQLEDCRAAVAFLRENGQQYKLATQRIGVCGASAGGHIVALMGTLDDTDKEKRASGVQAVCDFFGPTDLLTMPNNVPGEGKSESDLATTPEAQLLGGIVSRLPEKAKLASAFYQASAGTPPTLFIHGDADELVPLAQSQMLKKKLASLDCDTTLYVVKGAGHGMRQCQNAETKKLMTAFFKSHLTQPTPDQQEVEHLFVAKLLLRRLEQLNLTEDQMSQFNRLSHSLRTRMDKMRAEVGITAETITARDKAFRNAKNSGLKESDDQFWENIKTEAGLTDAQKNVFRETRGIYAEFKNSVLTEVLTEEQRTAYPKTKGKRKQ